MRCGAALSHAEHPAGPGRAPRVLGTHRPGALRHSRGPHWAGGPREPHTPQVTLLLVLPTGREVMGGR